MDDIRGGSSSGGQSADLSEAEPLVHPDDRRVVRVCEQAEVDGARFGVNIIPHTLTVTTWGAKTPGQSVNLEVDLFSRYIARLLEFRL